MRVGCLRKKNGVTALALRYRQGEHKVLGDLYDELEILVRNFIRSRLLGQDTLPPGLGAEDLYQQSYVALAEAVLEWEPDRCGNFMPYFLSSFPWRMDRYLRQQKSLRRTTHIQLCSMPHDELVALATTAIGVDGRDWDDIILCSDLMGKLPTLDRQVVQLHLFHGLSFTQVGKTLGINRSATYRVYVRAILQLKSLLGMPAAAAGCEA